MRDAKKPVLLRKLNQEGKKAASNFARNKFLLARFSRAEFYPKSITVNFDNIWY